jgi:hypothetical protein
MVRVRDNRNCDPRPQFFKQNQPPSAPPDASAHSQPQCGDTLAQKQMRSRSTQRMEFVRSSRRSIKAKRGSFAAIAQSATHPALPPHPQ